MYTPFFAAMLEIQQRHQKRVGEITAESQTVMDGIEEQFRQALEARELAFIGGRDAAITFDSIAHDLKMHALTTDYGSLFEMAASLGEQAATTANAALLEIISQMTTQVEMAKTLRESLLQQAAEERDEQLAQLGESDLGQFFSAPVLTVGEPCESCKRRGNREQANRCAARPGGTECGAIMAAFPTGQVLCPNCPVDPNSTGVRRSGNPCRLCPSHSEPRE